MARYVPISMKSSLFLYLAIAMGFYGVVQAEDDRLDAKLNALKEKMQRRTYSELAELDDRDLVVPKSQTDEEKELDARIRAIEQKLNSGSTGIPQRTVVRRRVRRPNPSSSANWLTPEVLAQFSKKDESAEEEDTSWVAAELARQEGLQQEKQSWEEEERLVKKRLQEELRRKARSSFTQAHDYKTPLQHILSGGAATEKKRTDWSTQLFPYSGLQQRSPSSEIEKRTESSSLRFTFPTSDRSGSDQNESSSFLKKKELNSGLSRRPLSTIVSQKPDEKKSEPSRRRKRPTFRSGDQNPFKDDWAPAMKNSIWD